MKKIFFILYIAGTNYFLWSYDMTTKTIFIVGIVLFLVSFVKNDPLAPSISRMWKGYLSLQIGYGISTLIDTNGVIQFFVAAAATFVIALGIIVCSRFFSRLKSKRKTREISEGLNMYGTPKGLIPK